MANTIRASKSTFQGGLVMDLAPDTTPNEVLTSALNATLITFNGNELSLQNDMGNGRVETARLPEGYIPVGTCEFGDIIYIVSYNPLTNKSQIGCFPSPERNISSEEIGSTEQTLSSSDFQEMNGSNPTGELKTNSVKKIIYNNKLNPGDKFILYDKNSALLNQNTITDLGNTQHTYGTFPKLVRIHVVAIEDSGKINYLDSTLRWYENNNKDYFITNSSSTTTGAPDIDSYRNLLSSGYSVFQSKVSGKLALLIELEKITGFSCTYNTYIADEKTENVDGDPKNKIFYKKCKVYWNISWETPNPNINPSHIVLTASNMIGKDSSKEAKWYYYKEDKGNYIYDDPKNYKDSLPESYSNTSNNYWYTSITNCYNLNNNYAYSDFIQEKSYDAVLKQTLSGIRNTVTNTGIKVYEDKNLVKLNIKRENKDGFNNLPVINTTNKGEYYINASTIEYKKSSDPKKYEQHIYTPDTKTGRSQEITDIPFALNDDIVNNYFHNTVYKYFTEFKIPVKQILNEKEFTPNISNLIYHYELTPAMPYGLLREYSIDGYIDLSKIGTGKIELNKWKYFNTENTSTLTLGLDAYIEDNMGISEVVLEFYDNQGFAAAYHITGKESYSGTFTEYLPLNGSSQSYKLNAYNAENNEVKQSHAGIEITNLEGLSSAVYLNEQGKAQKLYIKDNKAYTDDNYKNQYTKKIYSNDCGTLYSNILYLVKVVIKYCPHNALGELDTSDNSKFKYFYRWYWTNTMYNEYYYNTKDFKDLKFNLILDLAVKYKSTQAYSYHKFKYESPYNDLISNTDEVYKLLSAQVQVVSSTFKENDEKKRTYDYNTQISIDAGLNATYNTFSLRSSGKNADGTDNTDGAEDNISIDIITDGQQYVENVIETPEIVHAGNSLISSNIIQPELSDKYELKYYGEILHDKLAEYITMPSKKTEKTDEIYSNENSYKNYKNQFNITFEDTPLQYTNTNDQYVTYKNEASDFNKKYHLTKKLKEISGDKSIDLQVDIIHFSKYYALRNKSTGTRQVLTPLLYKSEDLDTYGLAVSSKSNPFCIKYLYTYYMKDDGDGTQNHLSINKYLVTTDGTDNGKFFKNTGWQSNFYDEWEDHADFSQFKNSNKSTVYTDRWDDWQNFITPGFSLITLERPNNKTNVYLNKNNDRESSIGILDNNFTKFYKGISNNNSMTYQINYSMDKNLCSWEDVYYTFVGIGYFGDSNNNYHMLNNWFIAQSRNKGSETTGNPWVQQTAQFGEEDYNSKTTPTNVGNIIASILASIYTFSSEDTTTIKYISDIVYLSNNYTSYTKDMIYKIYVNDAFKNSQNSQNSLINISTIRYDDYLIALKTNSGINENDIKEAGNNNIDVNLLSSIKNVPLQFKLNYISPDLSSLGDIGTNNGVTVLKINDKDENLTGEIEHGKLYYIKDDKEGRRIQLLDTNFIPDYYDSGRVDNASGRVYGTLSSPIKFGWKFPNIVEMFEYRDGKLRLSTNTAPTLTNTGYAFVTKEQDTMAIHDLLKSEVLIPYFKLMS